MLRNVGELQGRLWAALGAYTPVPPATHGQPGATTWQTMWHRGTLYSHSVWVSDCALRLLRDSSPWASGLQGTLDPAVLAHAALLHDLGKAGDLVERYVSKPGHEGLGVAMLLGSRPFLVRDAGGATAQLDARQHFLSVGQWSDAEQALIVFLAGCHSMFGFSIGELERGLESSEAEVERVLGDLCAGLAALARRSGVVGAQSSAADAERALPWLARLAALMNAADMMGLGPRGDGQALSAELRAGAEGRVALVPVEGIAPLWEHLRYDDVYLPMRHRLVRYAEARAAAAAAAQQGCS
eukprot:m51a1_g3687 hypothetical protein (298) ;mRNA; r:339125-340202